MILPPDQAGGGHKRTPFGRNVSGKRVTFAPSAQPNRIQQK